MPPMQIKYLMILACSFEMAAILVLFFDLLPCPKRQTDSILNILMYFFFTYTCKGNNQGGRAQEKQGIWMLAFPDGENTGN